MSFPTTPVLDNFNRANENPLSGGGNWSGSPWDSGTATLPKLQSNAVEDATASYIASSWWTAISAADVEVYVDMLGVTSAYNVLVGCRITGSNPTANCYRGGYFPGIPAMRIHKLISGAVTQVQSLSPPVFSVGDSVGLSVIGTTLTLHYQHSAVWTDMTPITDSSVTGAGFIGLSVYHNLTTGTTADNFGGGVPAGGPPPTELGAYSIGAF
jgi:hypothetical protein